MQKEGVREVVIPAFLPVRWNGHVADTQPNQYTGQAKYTQYDIERIHFATTNNLIRLYRRLAEQVQGVEIQALPDETPDGNLHLKLSDAPLDSQNQLLKETINATLSYMKKAPERRDAYSELENEKSESVDPYQEFIPVWEKLVAAAREGVELSPENRRALDIRNACLLTAQGLQEIITNVDIQKDPIKQAEAMVKYATGMTRLKELGITPDLNAELQREAYNDPLTLAEYVAGQLIWLHDEQLPSPVNVLREIEEHAEEMPQNPNEPHFSQAVKLDMDLLSPKFKNFLSLNFHKEATNRLLAFSLGDAPLSQSPDLNE